MAANFKQTRWNEEIMAQVPFQQKKGKHFIYKTPNKHFV
jgi:competence protein ComGF